MEFVDYFIPHYHTINMSNQKIVYVDIIYSLCNLQVKVNSVANKIATKLHLSKNPKPLLFIPMILCLILGGDYK